jgi:hypothetical protein
LSRFPPNITRTTKDDDLESRFDDVNGDDLDREFVQPSYRRKAPIGSRTSLKEIVRMVFANFQYSPQEKEAFFK